MMVPVEFVGKARAFRMAVAAAHPAAVAAVDRIAQPLRGQARLRQNPSASGLARTAAAWSNQVPATGRLDLAVKLTTSSLRITETRVGPVEFRFDAWDKGDVETAVVVTRTKLAVAAGRFEFDSVPLAAVSLHGLARWFQRASDVSDAAILTNLRALASYSSETLLDGGEFAEPAGDGQWVGVVTEIEDRGEAVPILVVRTFLPTEMGVRTNVAEMAAIGRQPIRISAEAMARFGVRPR
jgi:hypothetical protein